MRRLSISALLLILGVSTTFAQKERFTNRLGDVVYSYITINMGGGESNTLLFTNENDMLAKAKNKDGAAAHFGLNYELRKRNFLFGFGVEGEYAYTRQFISDFMEEFERPDYTGDVFHYRYRYTDYLEAQQTVLAGGQIHFGAHFTPHFYGLVGAKAQYPLMRNYETTTNLMTDGRLDRAIEYFENEPAYGLYPVDVMTKSGTYSTTTLFVGPTLELGYRLPIAPRVEMRWGGYAEYMFPIGQKHTLPLTDYSEVNIVPLEQTKAQLWESMKLNSILDYQNLSSDMWNWSRLTVGIRWTILFDVTLHHCFTCDEDTGIRYAQPKKILRMGATHHSPTSVKKKAKKQKPNLLEQSNLNFSD